MNSHLNRKLCLAGARGGDYVHPGEEEAIDIVMRKIPKNSSQLLLDVGCGLGGTAKYIKDNGWGSPVCIDKENDCIEYINSRYLDLETHVSDVIMLNDIFHTEQFDAAYLFSSFYAFENQQDSLRLLANLVRKQGYLIIFEYITTGKYIGPDPFHSKKNGFKPIQKDNIDQMLNIAGWHLEELADMTEKYIEWYTKLIVELTVKKDKLVEGLGLDTYETINRNFNELLEYMIAGKISGCALYARKVN